MWKRTRTHGLFRFAQLVLNRNDIDNAGAAEFAEALAVNCTLTEVR